MDNRDGCIGKKKKEKDTREETGTGSEGTGKMSNTRKTLLTKTTLSPQSIICLNCEAPKQRVS